MNNENHQPTAKIYQFPIRIRENVEKRRVSPATGSAYYLGKATAPMYSGAWYHDAAIKEDDRKR